MAMEKCHCIAINQFRERKTDDPKRKAKSNDVKRLQRWQELHIEQYKATRFGLIISNSI
jgi:hypothetical protein